MHIAYIGMGANLDSPAGSPAATLVAAAEQLASLGSIVARSSLYSTAPVGIREQPRFVNGVVAIETGYAPRALLLSLLAIEWEFGRDRAKGVPNGPRTLDLDLLLLGDIVLHEADLDLPHPRLAERAFVLVPLHEIAPERIEPRSGRTIAMLLGALKTDRAEEVRTVLRIADRRWPETR